MSKRSANKHVEHTCLFCGGLFVGDNSEAVPLYAWLDDGDESLRGYVHEDCMTAFVKGRLPFVCV